MPQIYNEEFRKNIVRLHLQEGRTYKSLIDEFGVSKASISKWCRDFSKECQTDPSAQKDSEIMQEIRRLRKQLQCLSQCLLQLLEKSQSTIPFGKKSCSPQNKTQSAYRSQIHEH